MDQLMSAFVAWLETMFAALPFEFLEAWGRVAYVVGIALLILAYGGFTFMPAGRWGFGRERQVWGAAAFKAMAATAILIIGSGYIGSFIVLVPGAQTFESLKDCAVFLCIVLFGRPALLITPIAYGISDLIEGVQPAYELDWALGYWINPAFFWLAYQLIGRMPDFRRARTWAKYLVFVALFMLGEPQLWGYICADKFTPQISYHEITPALFFTTSITWLVSPLLMLAAYPFARRMGWYWKEIPGYVKERLAGQKEWLWESGTTRHGPVAEGQGVPLVLLLVGPFLTLTLVMVMATAYVGFRSAENAATKLVGRLHEEVAENINIQLDEFLERSRAIDNSLLSNLPIAEHGLAVAIDASGRVVLSSVKPQPPGVGAAVATDGVVRTAIGELYRNVGSLDKLQASRQFRFSVVTATPLSRETWLAQATAYSDRSGKTRWTLVTAMPEAYYLSEIRSGNSHAAMIYAVALVLSLVTVIVLAAFVSNPVRRIAQASSDLAEGDWSLNVPDSRIEELSFLSRSFNAMTSQLRDAFHKVKMGEAIVDSSEDAIIGKTLDGNVSRWNHGAEAIFGYSADEMLGQTMLKLIPSARQDEEQRLLAAIRDGKSVQHFQTERLCKDGRTIQVSMSFSPIRNETLQVIGASVIARDITAHKKAEAAIVSLNARLQALFDAAQEVAIIATDAVGKIVVFNHGAERMLGYPARTMLEQDLTSIYRQSELRKREAELGVNGFEALVAMTRAGKSEIRSWTCVRHDGTALQVSQAVSPVYDDGGRISGFLAIARDITQQLAAEENLRILNQQLDLRVQERTRELRRTQDQLVQSEKLAALGSIVAAVSHELNTPIGNCVCVASTIKDKTDDFESEVASGKVSRKNLESYMESSRTAMELLERGLKRASDLISNFKQVAVDQSTEKRRLFQLSDAIGGVVELLRVTLRKSAYRIELDIAESIQMDSYPGAMEQLISNLVNNAVLHGFAGREHGVMHIRAIAVGVDVRLVFSDDGVGMTDDVLRHVFDPFFTTRLGTGGSGLGLNICYNLVTNLLGGQLKAESRPGEGATFIITVPRVAPESTAAVEEALNANSRILLGLEE